jgi:integrase
MGGTGVRISEALGQAWADIDLDAGTVHVRGTKTAASRRTLTMPSWLVEVLRERRARGIATSGVVFASTKTGLRRDPSAATRALRSLFDRAGFPWATPHSLRRTVASLIDGAGLPIAMAADQLGHADPSMTARVYLGRGGDTSRAAAVL